MGPPPNPRQERGHLGGCPPASEPPPAASFCPRCVLRAGLCPLHPGGAVCPSPPSCPRHPRGLPPALGILLSVPPPPALGSAPSIRGDHLSPIFLWGTPIKFGRSGVGARAGEAGGVLEQDGTPRRGSGGGRGSLQAGVPVPLGFFPACTPPPPGHPTPSWGAQGPPGGAPGAQEHPQNHTQPPKGCAPGLPSQGCAPHSPAPGWAAPPRVPQLYGQGEHGRGSCILSPSSSCREQLWARALSPGTRGAQDLTSVSGELITRKVPG